MIQLDEICVQNKVINHLSFFYSILLDKSFTFVDFTVEVICIIHFDLFVNFNLLYYQLKLIEAR